jgi:hypothetical protein
MNYKKNININVNLIIDGQCSNGVKKRRGFQDGEHMMFAVIVRGTRFEMSWTTKSRQGTSFLNLGRGMEFGAQDIKI